MLHKWIGRGIGHSRVHYLDGDPRVLGDDVLGRLAARQSSCDGVDIQPRAPDARGAAEDFRISNNLIFAQFNTLS